MSIHSIAYDETDRKLGLILMQDATLTNAAIGELIGLSASATNERVRKLKADGVIKKVVALFDCHFMDMALGAYIFVLVEWKDRDRTFIDGVTSHDNVLECHHLTGEYSYMLKVRVADTKALENFITDFLKGQMGVIKTMTHIILSSPKDQSVVCGENS